MDDMKMNKYEQKLISTYTVYGFDPFHAGTTLLFTGGIVGIPLNFKYSTVEQFDHTGITVSKLESRFLLQTVKITFCKNWVKEESQIFKADIKLKHSNLY